MTPKPDPPPLARPRRIPFVRLGPGRGQLWWGAVVLAVAVLLIAALTVVFWKPAPPATITMATGPQQSAYDEYGKRYRDILARSGVQVVLESSSGALENLERLRHARQGVTIGFVASGLAAPGDAGRLVSLGAVAYEALWVFYRSDLRIETVTDIKGLRVAAGAEGSATRRMAARVLEINGISGSEQPLMELDGLAAADALRRGEVDVAMLLTTSEDDAVERLMRAPGVMLLGFRRADAYVKRIPGLVKVEIPEGAADLAHNLPARTATLLAVRSYLVTGEGVHPVLVDLLLDAAREVHGSSGLIRNAGEFPSGIAGDLPVSPEAERYFKTGPSVLQSYLPYWAVVWVHRLVFFGFPILVVLVPLLRLSPLIYRWSMRRRIYRWYGELSFIQQALEAGSGDQRAHLRRLHEIERRVNAMQVPLAFAGEAYQLRMHVDLVRNAVTPPLDRTAG
ncbi:MAG: ABC transporter substrate-binding protein [Proteobacteria bacterium]|nr:ABC transporter substrate-binding protein [Pseudomonadota bacterium]